MSGVFTSGVTITECVPNNDRKWKWNRIGTKKCMDLKVLVPNSGSAEGLPRYGGRSGRNGSKGFIWKVCRGLRLTP